MKLKYFDLARKLSKKSDHPKFQLGCVIVRGNKIVSIGFNQLKTHPKSVTPYRQLHAELSAILDIDKRTLAGCQAYVYREHRDGTLAVSRPCQYCQAALTAVGITQVFFTDEDGYKVQKLND